MKLAGSERMSAQSGQIPQKIHTPNIHLYIYINSPL